MKFSPCTGQCTQDGTHCLGCGRSHEEIAETKQLVGALAEFAIRQGYENKEDFAIAMAKSLMWKFQNS